MYYCQIQFVFPSEKCLTNVRFDNSRIYILSYFLNKIQKLNKDERYSIQKHHHNQSVPLEIEWMLEFLCYYYKRIELEHTITVCNGENKSVVNVSISKL